MTSEIQNLKRFVKDEENMLGILQRYFERYQKREEEVSNEAKVAKQQLGQIVALEGSDKGKKLASWLAMSYDMYNLKLDNVEDTVKKFLPAVQELRDQLSSLKETTDQQYKHERKLTPEARTAVINRLKQLTRKYLQQRLTMHRLIQEYHAKSCLSEFSQYIERVTNLMQKMKNVS